MFCSYKGFLYFSGLGCLFSVHLFLGFFCLLFFTALLVYLLSNLHRHSQNCRDSLFAM